MTQALAAYGLRFFDERSRDYCRVKKGSAVQLLAAHRPDSKWKYSSCRQVT